MNRISNLAPLGCLIVLLGFAADGQPRGYGPNYPPRDDPYYREGPNGRYNDDRYPRQRAYDSSDLIGRILADLEIAARNSWIDGHERKHFEKADRSLRAFENRSAQGRFDRGKLDEAIKSLEHLVNADRISDRERDLLARDIQDLHQFRASGGRYMNQGNRGFRNGRYDPNGRYDGDWRR